MSGLGLDMQSGRGHIGQWTDQTRVRGQCDGMDTLDPGTACFPFSSAFRKFVCLFSTRSYVTLYFSFFSVTV